MTFWASARGFVSGAKRELRIRGRLLAAVFSPARSEALPLESDNNSLDLIAGLNSAGEAVGVNAWDWDIAGGVFRYNREVFKRAGGESGAANADLGLLIDSGVYPEDRARFRAELVEALKGNKPLCINYRVTHSDSGSVHPVQLRGSIFRGPDGRATRVVGYTIDMTLQEEAAQQIAIDSAKQRQLFERLSLATEAAGIGVWDWDIASGKLGADSNMSSIFTDANFDGITRAEDFVRRILHPDDRQRFLNTIQNAIRRGGGERVSTNFRYMRSDGGLHHVELHGRIVRDAVGDAVRLLFVSWNITAKVEAQTQLLKHSEAQQVLLDRLNLATEVAALDVWDWNLLTDRIVADAFHKEAFGAQYFDEGNVRELIASMLHPEDISGYFAALDRALESGSTFFHRFRMIGRDGAQRFVQSNARIFRNESGRAIRVLGVSQDVSNEMEHLEELRRQANEERALRDRLNLATQTAGIAIWDKDMIRGDFVCNEQFWETFGLKPNPRLKVHEGIHPDEREQALIPLAAAFADPTRDEILSIRHRTSNPRPEPQYVQTHMRVFREHDGRVKHLLGVTWDVTAEVVREEELKRQADKERALVERLNMTTQSAGISPWEFDLKTNRFSWHGFRLPVFGLDHVPLERYFEALLEVTLEEDRYKLTDLPRQAVENGAETYQTEFRIRGAHGQIYHLRNKCHLQRNAKNQVRYIMGITMDVTQEVAANLDLARRDEEKRKLIERLGFATESANIGFWEIDLVANRFLWVENSVSALGIADRDFDSLAKFSERIVEADRKLMPENIRKALNDGTHRFGFRYRAYGADNSIVHVQSYGRVFVDEGGRPVRTLGVSWDATKEVEIAEQLRRQAEMERVLVDRLNVATQAAGISPWEYDLIANRFSWIGAPLEVLGLDISRPDAYLDEVTNIVVPEDQHILKEATLDALAKNLDVFSYRYRAKGVDGKIHHLKNFARVIRSPRGTPYRLVGVTWDATEEVVANEHLQKQAEQERKLVQRLNIATDSAGISSWELDLASGKFLWIENPLKSVYYDGDEGSMSADFFVERIVPEDRPLMREAIAEALKNHSDRIQFRYRALGNHGRIVHVQSFARLLFDGTMRISRVLGVSLDVTHEVEVAEQLQKQAQYERELLERLNVATQGAGISMWEFDLKTNQYSWHSSRMQVLGLDDVPLELYFEALKAKIVPEDRHLITEVPTEAVRSGKENYTFSYRVAGTDGKLYYVQNYARVLRSARGTAYRLIGVTWDVTKDVDARAELERQFEHSRQLTERLNIATDSAGISTWEIDLVAKRFLWIENPIRSLWRDSDMSDEANSASTLFVERTLAEDRGNMKDAIKEALAKGSDRISYRYRAHGHDGALVHVQSFARLIFDDNKKIIRILGVSWDMTREAEATERLARQAQTERMLLDRLSVATQSAGISTWEIDLVTAKFLWVENPISAAQDARGSSQDLANFANRMHPDDRKLMSNEIKKAAKEGRDVIRYCYRIYRLDGGIAYIQTYAKLYFNEERRATRALGVSWDSTKEVEAGAKLANAERRLERASLSSSEGHWEAELATGHLWCSSSFHTLLGYRTGELEAHITTLDYLIHQDDRNAYGDALKAHLLNNAPFDVELRLRMTEGEYRWFRMRGAAERNAAGEPILIAGAIHDVHQQKLIEDALRQAQSRFERAINGTQDGLWELDVGTGDAWCSPRLALLLGYTTEQLGTRNFLQSLIHRDDAAKLDSVTRAHYRDNSPFDLEIRLQTRNGEYRWYRARATAERGPNGRALRLSGSLQDVSDARAAREELLRATEAAEAANRAKSAFLANMSHEIRTPMNGIVGMTGLLLDTDLNRTQREYADTIRGSADSLLTIINDILDFSKIEAGKLDLEYIDVDLRVLVEDVASMMAFQAANKGLELIVNVHPETPDRVKGDPQRLRQCLVNLIGNAVKFTKSGEIAVDVCAIGRHEGRVLTHFEIRDTGIGIPQNTLKTLFQPFVQADSSTTRHFGGTGLGLSIVRRLIEMMGGQVGVVSEVGKGSNFFFTLSLESVETSVDEHASTEISDGRILIVDDNATNRRVLRLQLEHNGYRIITAASGADALSELSAAVARGQPIDMTITDFQMPDMDGAMLAARIAADPALTNTRLIMLTSLDKQGDTQRLAALGFAAYLTKPIRRDELLTCVRRVFAGEARQWQMEIRPMITRNTLAQIDAQQKFSGRVLLVEDNEVNQKVASRVLERMGCTVQIAEHGQAGVEAFLAGHFDLVLMDLQMPVMDGMAAARKIRELESVDTTRKRTPIVALTANALKGDRELCEAAGMDDYLTKPLEIDRLRATLARFGMAVGTPDPTARQNAPPTMSIKESPPGVVLPPIDLGQLNRLVDGDDEFMRELLVTFLTSGIVQIDDLDKATQAFDRPAIARAAHKLKGGCGNIHAYALRDLASEIEATAATAENGQLLLLCEKLRGEFTRAEKFLSDPSIMPIPIRAAS